MNSVQLDSDNSAVWSDHFLQKERNESLLRTNTESKKFIAEPLNFLFLENPTKPIAF